MTQKRPQQGEYADYFEKYIALVPRGDFLEILQEQEKAMIRLLSPLSDQQADFRYAPGKWSIKEVLGHINDAERIFAYRLLRIARGDQTPLPVSNRTAISRREISHRESWRISCGNFPPFAKPPSP